MAKPMGRPSKYKPEFDQMLIEHMRQGLSFESFAAIAGVAEETIHDWCRPDSDHFRESFSESKKLAFQYNRIFWDKKALEALDGENNINPTVLIFNLKNRFPKQWRDKTEQVIDAKVENVDATKKIEDKLNGLLAEIQSRKSK